MDAYTRDVAFVIVSVPPGLVARAMAPPTHRSPAARQKFAAVLHGAAPSPRLAAVYERHGVDLEVLVAEYDLAERQEEDYQTQLNCWFDIGTSRRTETDITNPAGVSLFEEPRWEEY
jgi:hypothetical protein